MIYVMNLLNLVEDNLYKIEELETLEEEPDDCEDYYLVEIETKAHKYDLIQNQQKEFISYLEKRYKDVTSVIGSYGSNTDMLYGKKDMLEEILQKYKSIIGDVKNEN